MKTAVLSLAAISLIQLAAAQPHRRHAHMVLHEKRDAGEVVSTVIETVIAMATNQPEVLVYVDDAGKPVSTATNQLAAAPSLVTLKPSVPPPAPTPQAPPKVNVAAVQRSSTTELTTTSATPSPTTSTSTQAPTSSAAPAVINSSGGSGFTYGPYNGDKTCKTSDQVNKDFAAFPPGVGIVRSYGMDCNTIPNVYGACKQHGIKLMAGIFDIGDIPGQVALLVEGVKGDWSGIYAVIVGNELVNSHQASVDTVMTAVAAARTLLRLAGYNGPVSTADTLVATQANPELALGSDIVFVNNHIFFDPGASASEGESWTLKTIAGLKSALGDSSKKIVCSETGYPHQGDANGGNVPSPSNQKLALDGIQSAYESLGMDYILLSPFDTPWKDDFSGSFQAEKFWGIHGPPPSG